MASAVTVMPPPSEAPANGDAALHQQSLLFSDTLKDLKELRSQLYSAAEYFELSYTNDDHKEIVVSTLKDYATKALFNAVDHLGSVSYKVDGLVSNQFDEVSGTEFQVSCIEQRIRTCQGYIDQKGLTEQSLLISAPRYHKRYIQPGAGMPVPALEDSPVHRSSNIPMKDKEPQEFRTELRSTIREPHHSFKKPNSPSPAPRTRSSSPGKMRFPSPSLRVSRIFPTEKRSVSPIPTSSLHRSGSLSCRPNVRTPSSGRQRPSEIKKPGSASEGDGRKNTEKNSSKSRGFLRSLLSRRQTREDDMLYTYLNEY